MEKQKQCVVVSKEMVGKEECVGYGFKNISEYEGIEGERFLTHGFLMDSFRKLMGKTLTIIDSAIGEDRQNKATKDLVRNMFSDELNFANDMAYDQKVLQKLAEKSMKELNDEDFTALSIEDALGVKES